MRRGLIKGTIQGLLWLTKYLCDQLAALSQTTEYVAAMTVVLAAQGAHWWAGFHTKLSLSFNFYVLYSHVQKKWEKDRESLGTRLLISCSLNSVYIDTSVDLCVLESDCKGQFTKWHKTMRCINSRNAQINFFFLKLGISWWPEARTQCRGTQGEDPSLS